jgi:light-regulated signal transduction histidine kinase (bacteriophytochrome)/CheY-like chemotaxis protein
MDQKIDISQCDMEEVHLIDCIQPFAVLIEFSPSGHILRYSENAPDFMSVEENSFLKCSPDDLFPSGLWEVISNAASSLDELDQVKRIFHVAGVLKDNLVDINICRSIDGFIVEFERCMGGIEADFMPEVRDMSAGIDPANDAKSISQEAAEYIRYLTGFQRVMVYRFHEDFTGEVIAESADPALESYVGLRYPASDIPSQARALYQKNLIRIIADVEAAPVRLRRQPQQEASERLDLSMCISRCVSPIHIQYLKNMGVRSSMSISIVTSNGLWGMIACHNVAKPHYVSHPRRSATELFGQIFSFKIGESEAIAQRDLLTEGQRAHARIMALFAGNNTLKENFEEVSTLIKSAIACDGVFAKLHGERLYSGQTPGESAMENIEKFLSNRADNKVFSTTRISAHIEEIPGGEGVAAGMMVIPLSRMPQDYIILFRSELAKTVRWAGHPDKQVVKIGGNTRLQPRESFAEWQQLVLGTSAEWSSRELLLADFLRSTLVEVLFKLSEERAKEKERAQQRQELLINELNHRVRNIIALMSGLVEQTASGQKDVETLAGVLQGRIKALAEAHNLMTNASQAPASLRSVLEIELAPHSGAGLTKGRWEIDGPDILLAPDSLPIFALVFHELATNAVKYGALSSGVGHVTVSVEATDDGGFILEWRESGGPPVSDTNRPGTGTELIEEAIPFQLSGEAKLDLRASGMVATFKLPATVVKAVVRSPNGEGGRVEGMGNDAQREIKLETIGSFLILDDQYLIAKTLKKTLHKIGVENVYLASSTKQAKDILDGHLINFCILDINLGGETSESIAHYLIEIGIPFIFVSGYGDAALLPKKFDQIPRLAKPYRTEELFAHIPSSIRLNNLRIL